SVLAALARGRERSTERHRAELDPIQPSASARTAAVRRDARHVPEMGLQRTAGDERGLLPQCAVVPDRNRHANVAPRKARPAGALVVAWLGKFKRMGVTALTMQAIYGLLILAFSMSHTIWLSEVLLLFTGASLMMVFSTITSLVQLIAPNAMRGRVMSIYMVA